jgi:hypothetical protein
MLVAAKDFQGEIAIAQIEQPDVWARVQWFVDKYEPLCLCSLLGDALAEEFITEYPKPEHDEKWNNLAAKLRPIIANIIYYNYQADNETTTTGVGEVDMQGENSTRTTVAYKAVRAWNENVELIYDFIRWIDVLTFTSYGGVKSHLLRKKNTFGI